MVGLNQNILVTTIYDDSVSSALRYDGSYNTMKAIKGLNIDLSNSITMMNSNYFISFETGFIPVANSVIVTLSNMHKINGGCHANHNSTLLKGSWSCSIVNTSAIKL